jgi:UDP-N-acetyl-D-glucosamine dehydrogenase
VPTIGRRREHSQWAGKRSVKWDETTIGSLDLILVATNHSTINYQELGKWARCIVDTRNAMGSISQSKAKIWKA